MSAKPAVRRLAALALAVVLLAPQPPARAAAPRRAVALVSVQAATLERAREGALRKLERADCQRILDDFKDAQGKPLRAALARWGRTPSDYLRIVPFLDGSAHPPCQSGRAELFAEVGVPRVFVCRSFADKQVRDPWTAENMVIHELLHTLGLGENPPTSGEITARVNGRCQ
jgi:hypothetical protein